MRMRASERPAPRRSSSAFTLGGASSQIVCNRGPLTFERRFGRDFSAGTCGGATGAGGGLGRCHALELARRGAKVVINDLGGTLDGTGGNSEAAEAVVKEIEAMGGEAIANGSSVSDEAGVKKMIDDTMAKCLQQCQTAPPQQDRRAHP